MKTETIGFIVMTVSFILAAFVIIKQKRKK